MNTENDEEGLYCPTTVVLGPTFDELLHAAEPPDEKPRQIVPSAFAQAILDREEEEAQASALRNARLAA